MEEIKEGVYLIPNNLRAIIKDGGKTLVVQERKGRNPYLKEGEYRCRNCTHFIQGYWSKKVKWYKTFVCDKKPKGDGCFYACPYYGKPCEYFNLKS